MQVSEKRIGTPGGPATVPSASSSSGASPHAAAHNPQERQDGSYFAEGPASTAPAHSSNEPQKTSNWRDLLIWCAIPILVVLVLRLFLFGMYVIPSASMENTIMPGDRVVTTKLAPRFIRLQRGDIVVFRDPDGWLANESTSTNYLIKRVIGLPGDTVACAGAGQPITINGAAINESSYLKPGDEPSMFPFSVTVTAGHLFVMGDNRSNSSDSRYHLNDKNGGLVPESDVVGVAFLRYWPFDRIGWLSAHHDVFQDVPAVTD